MKKNTSFNGLFSLLNYYQLPLVNVILFVDILIVVADICQY